MGCTEGKHARVCEKDHEPADNHDLAVSVAGEAATVAVSAREAVTGLRFSEGGELTGVVPGSVASTLGLARLIGERLVSDTPPSAQRPVHTLVFTCGLAPSLPRSPRRPHPLQNLFSFAPKRATTTAAVQCDLEGKGAKGRAEGRASTQYSSDGEGGAVECGTEEWVGDVHALQESLKVARMEVEELKRLYGALPSPER